VPDSSAALDPVVHQERPRTYRYRDTPQGPLDIHVQFPARWTPTDRRPAVVFFFGGGWRAGGPDHFLRQATYLANRGLVTARADYRVHSRHGTTPYEAVEDAQSAVRWLRARAETLGVDPGRIVGAGGSAGGHLAACAALSEVLEVPHEDLAVSCRPNLLVLFNPALDMTGRFAAALGEGPEGARRARRISPVLHLEPGAAPAVLFYGGEDALLAQGRDFLAAAHRVGHSTRSYVAPGQRHGFFNHSPWTEATMWRTDEFLAEHGYLEGSPRLAVPPGATLERQGAA